MTALRYLLFAIAGAAIGYVGLFIYANSEEWVFYSLRSYATGEKAMSQIVQHPADYWVCLSVWTSFIGGGALSGLLVAWRSLRQ